MNTKLTCQSVLIVTTVLFGPVQSVNAAMIAADSFEYSGGNLDGQNGGSGWSGAWSGGTGGNVVVAPGSTYSDGSYSLTAAGNSVSMGGFNSATFRSLSQILGTPGTTIYASCIVSSAAGADYAGLAFFQDATEEFFVGRTAGSLGYFTSEGGSAISFIDPANPSLLVVRFDFEATHTIASLYVNPPLGAEPSTSSLRGDWRLPPFTFNRVRIAAGGSATTASIDEVRLGESFDDVTPDNTPALPFVTIKRLELNEGDVGTSIASVEVRLNQSSVDTVTVDYATSDLNTTAGEDYVAVTSSVTFDPGETLKYINITINGDTMVEPVENLLVSLANPVNAQLAESSTPVVLVNDDWNGLDLIFYEPFDYSSGATTGRNRTMDRHGRCR